MAATQVNSSDTFEQWRIKTNLIGADVGDLDSLTTAEKANLVDAINSIDASAASTPDDVTIELDENGRLAIKNDGVTKAQLNVDVAGVGLKQNQDESLSPDTDDTSLTTESGVLAIKDGGVTSSKLAMPLTVNQDNTDEDFVINGENVEVFRVDSNVDRVGIKTTNPVVSLDASGSTDGIRVSNGATAQRPSNAKGIIRFNTDTDSFESNDGSSWNTFGAASAFELFETTSDSPPTNRNVWVQRKPLNIGNNPSNLSVSVASDGTITMPHGIYYFSSESIYLNGGDGGVHVRVRTTNGNNVSESGRQGGTDDSSGLQHCHSGVIQVDDTVVFESFLQGGMTQIGWIGSAYPLRITFIKLG